jgi:hypothetical protein
MTMMILPKGKTQLLTWDEAYPVMVDLKQTYGKVTTSQMDEAMRHRLNAWGKHMRADLKQKDSVLTICQLKQIFQLGMMPGRTLLDN